MSSDPSVLLEKIKSRQARVAVVGLGYVGLPLAVAFAQEQLCVVGIDLDPRKVEAINAGQSYISDVPAEALASVVQQGCLRAASSFEALDEVDAVVICVPTPLSKTRDPDISYIVAATDQIAQHLRAGQLVVLESTTYPGTTVEIILPRLTGDGLQVGSDFFLAFSPERIDPANQRFTLRNTPKVVGGVTPACREMATALYGMIVETLVPVSDTQTAEMVKLLENTFRAVNIGLINEVAIMCDRLDVDVWEVIEAASTKPYGFMSFYPGPGLGGHCIPLDPFYLSWKLKTLNYNARFIELAGDINSHMPHYVVNLVADALNERGKPIRGSRILLLGVTYKANVSDVRESPALDIIRLLQDKGAALEYHDPYIPSLAHDGFDLSSSALTPELLAAMDCVVIVTPHASYDWEEVCRHAPLIVDTRNAIKERAPHVVRL